MKRFVTLSADQLPAGPAEIRVGIRSVPYLADHGFQDLVVLPGSFYVDTALCVERELSRRIPSLIRNVVFHNPIILAAEDSVIRIELSDRGGGRVEYSFYEAGVADGDARQLAATLEIDRNPPRPARTEAGGFSIEAFQAQSSAAFDAEQFYKTFRLNGNQYGPRFQNVASIWRAGSQSLGRLSAARRGDEPHCLHPTLLDSMTHLLAAHASDKGKTFVLQSIGEIELADLDFPDTLWGHASLLAQSGGGEKGIRGDVRIFDRSGKTRVRLSGVAFALLDRVAADDDKAALNLAIAANFTAEPLEDALNFWADHFGVRLDVEFAPYNQVFQQLLDAGSAFRRNSDGANIILLGLEEWAAGDQRAPMELSKDKAQQCFGARPRCVLPNGLEIVHLNQYETDYVYREIFEDQCYLRHGIRLRDGDTVVDIGANIGLFSLFVMSRCKDARIYACEPAPVVYDLLKANCDAYGSNVRALNVGVSDRRKTATFTFYEKSSVFSGFHSDEAEDREAIRAIVRNMLNESVADESVEEYVDELTADRLNRKTQECQLTSVSDIIREHRIERIDLLKVDAEKSELDIIKGIEDGDWPKIKQLVLEIHDPTQEAIKRIEQLLIERGYRCAVEQETLLAHAGLFNLYATRDSADDEARSEPTLVEAGAARPRPARRAADSLKRNVQEFGGALRSFMDQAKVPLVLCVCPRTPAADADAGLRAALDAAEAALLSAASSIANVHAIGSASPLMHYPLDDYFDSHSHRAGHIPYTPECYAAIATALVRTVSGLKRNPFKVVVLDCDNTLWKGVCGEDGPEGIEVTAEHRSLQEFMIDRMHAGMLLCLCSKNSEREVLDVLDQRADMPLKREHLVSWRINWDSKSANIRSLAKELNLGLDSFIFVDDNPVECADVRINCPGVLTLQLPRNPESFASFLDHVWAFDQAALTEEDKNRTRMYQQSSERQQFREQSFSLKDFVKGLQLRVEIAEATADQIGRISQLTLRTNQFNFTTVRRSETEIHEFLKQAHAKCLTVRVADRFGDYGLVGVLMFEAKADRYKIDTFLLSCRVLGRGVEHALASRLGQMAAKDGKAFVEFVYLPTNKNLPALQFITSIGERYRNDSGTSWTFPAEGLAAVEYDPQENAPVEPEEAAGAGLEKPASRRPPAFGGADWHERLLRIAEELCDIERLAKAIDQHRAGKQPLQGALDLAPGSALEAALVNIWRKVLGKPRIGLNDNFFEVGGTSLRAVQVVAMIKRELNQALSIVNLFECPTVSLLAAKMSAPTAAAQAGSSTSTAAARGQQRRHNTTRRKTS